MPDWWLNVYSIWTSDFSHLARSRAHLYKHTCVFSLGVFTHCKKKSEKRRREGESGGAVWKQWWIETNEATKMCRREMAHMIYHFVNSLIPLIQISHFNCIDVMSLRTRNMCHIFHTFHTRKNPLFAIWNNFLLQNYLIEVNGANITL